MTEYSRAISGPVDTVFETVFEAAIARGEIAQAVHAGWRIRNSIAWEVSHEGQLYSLNRRVTETNLAWRVETIVKIKDLETLQKKAVEFRQVRVKFRSPDRQNAVTAHDRDLLLEIAGVDINRPRPKIATKCDDGSISVMMTLNMAMPETALAGLPGLEVDQLAELPDSFHAINDMTIAAVHPYTKTLTMCELVKRELP